MTLLGPSGCGKTTLLRIDRRLRRARCGPHPVGGKDITHLPPNRRQVGFVFQNYALFPHLTVAGNVAYGLRVRRPAAPEIRERVARALDLVAARRPSPTATRRSSRAASSSALPSPASLVLEPEVLLLDEPFNALDAKLRLTMQVELRKLIERVGITSIFVTHDQDEAMTLSDSIAVMRAGRIEQVGAAARDLRPARGRAYVADFIGRANLVPVTRRAAGASPACRAIAAPGQTARERSSSGRRTSPSRRATGSGWRGTVAFATALGPTVEYEIACGLAEPLRVVAPRRAGGAHDRGRHRRARRHRRTLGGAASC